jgi:signal transduction histidine kinase
VVVAHRAHGLIAVTRRPGVEPFAEEDVDLLDRLAVQLGLVIQIARGRSARQRVAVLQDRQRIARDLHDTVIQDLIGLGMAVHAEARHEPDPVRRSRDRDVVDQIDRVVRRLRASVLQLRDRPPGATVTESIESLVAEAARALGHTPALRLAGPVDRLPATVADEVVPVLREALSNVARHARASATCVEVTVGEGGLRIVVEDDGRGPVAIGRGGTGLANLRERAAAHGGRAGLTAREGGRARLTWQCPVGGADGAPVPQR